MTKTNEIQNAALDTIYMVSSECTDKSPEGLHPFHSNTAFNAMITKQMNVSGFTLDNATWNELVARAKEEMEAAGGTYASVDIAKGMYGNAVNYLIINLVMSYGIARAVKRLRRANRHLYLFSAPMEIARDIAFRLLEDKSIKSTGYETLQAQTIKYQLNPAQMKARLEKMIQNGVSNYIKGLQVPGKLNPNEFNPIEAEEVGEQAYEEPDLSVEEELQLEYLYEFMRRGYEDIQALGGPAAKAMEVWCSEQGQQILAETNHNKTTFYTQLLQLTVLSDLTEQETKQAHDQILNTYWQLTKISQSRQVQKRKQIASKAYRSDLAKGIKTYQSKAVLKDVSVVNTMIDCPWIDDEDVELMRRESINGFFSRMPNEFALN